MSGPASPVQPPADPAEAAERAVIRAPDGTAGAVRLPVPARDALVARGTAHPGDAAPQDAAAATSEEGEADD